MEETAHVQAYPALHSPHSRLLQVSCQYGKMTLMKSTPEMKELSTRLKLPLFTELRYLAVEHGSIQDLVNEAIEDLLAKYKKKSC